MGLRGLLLFNMIVDALFIAFIIGVGLTDSDEGDVGQAFGTVDVSQIPKDTVSWNHAGLKLENGVYYLAGEPFSGFILKKYENGSVNSVGSYFQGMQHGVSKSFYPNGKLRDSRMYKENVSYGRHFGYWENGNRKFDFVYYNDKREGLQKQWYESGEQYAFLSFKDDREEGMQRAWRINGKPYINYEVKDGIRYGLQKAALCYTLKDEKLK
ncbi:toxin-antitoxin system YwqK family antitoxin [Persicitalea jodogahamensis]|uniref:Uncharacterized protein n=1 Tax=Persicitalea jodogahamensis TaxID=402147 RepID=A0A8J3GAV3_9BACT|nr:hypothetical protein [Persicitalea jodogahamensis]GHB76923.1 hypothetical protein GCM10007390_33630 [Persicitalea jodogahamensis]